MKKINNKGFTLIELLAIIVILAIILIITIPQVFKAVDNSKRSALLTSAGSLYKWYNTTKTADALVENIGEQVLASYPLPEKPTCLSAQFFEIAEVTYNDYNVNGVAPTITDNSQLSDTKRHDIKLNTCSYYYKNEAGNPVFVLVANPNGKLYLGPDAMWASSDGDHSW